VKLTTKRKWVRLVGRRYDLQMWQPDDRVCYPKYPNSHFLCPTNSW
jgi:hypothetical protein